MSEYISYYAQGLNVMFQNSARAEPVLFCTASAAVGEAGAQMIARVLYETGSTVDPKVCTHALAQMVVETSAGKSFTYCPVCGDKTPYGGAPPHQPEAGQ